MATPCLAAGVVAKSSGEGVITHPTAKKLKSMEQKYIVTVKDENRIKAIHFKFPHLMDSNSEQEIKWEYEKLLAKREALYSARDEVRRLEKQVSELEKEWALKETLFDIEFESYEKEITTTKSYMVINGKTVYDCNGRR